MVMDVQRKPKTSTKHANREQEISLCFDLVGSPWGIVVLGAYDSSYNQISKM